MDDQLDIFLNQFYGKYSPNDIPQGERRARLKEKLSQDFDGYVNQMYAKYAPDNMPDSTRLSNLRSKYMGGEVETQPTQEVPLGATLDPQEQQVADEKATMSALNPVTGALLKVPVIGDLLYGGGKQLATGVTDQIPKAVEQTGEVIESALEGGQDIKDYVKQRKSVDFQKFVRDNDPNFKGIKGALTAFDFDKYWPQYSEAFIKKEKLEPTVESLKSAEPEKIKRRLALEEYVNQQNEESAQKMQGVIGSYKDIHSIKDVGNYVGNMATQGLWQIPLTIVTRGLSSEIMEAAEVYDQQIDQIAESKGLTRKQVIEKGLDRPAAGQLYALAAASLDKVSADGLLSMIKGGGAALVKNAIGAGMEAVTEPIQGSLEETGGAAGAGLDQGEAFKKAWSEHLSRRIDEAIGGALGSQAINVLTPNAKHDNEVEQTIKQAEKDATEQTTGNPSVDKTIDDLAMESTHFADEVLSRVEDLGTEGSKMVDDFIEMGKQVQTATDKAKAAEQKQFIAEKLNEFNQSPLATTLEQRAAQLPVNTTQAGEATANAAIDPFTGQTGAVESQYLQAPESNIPEQINLTQPVTTKNDSENKQRVQGQVRTRKESVIGQPKPRRGRKTTGPSGVLQTPTIQEKKVEEKIETSLTKGQPVTVNYFGRKVEGTIDKVYGKGTFDVISKGVTYPMNSKKDIWVEGIAPTSKVKQEADKALEEEKQHKTDLEIELRDSMVKERKPWARLTALDKIIERADEAGLTKVAEEAQKLRDKEADHQEEQAAKKEIKAEQAKKTTEQKEAEKQAKIKIKEEAKAKKFAKKAFQSVKAAPSIAYPKGLELPKEGDTKRGVMLQHAKDTFLGTIAKFTQEGKISGQNLTPEDIENKKQAIAEYHKFREDNGLKAITDESIETRIKQSAAIKKAKIILASERAKRVETKRSKPKTEEELALQEEDNAAAVEQAHADVKKELGNVLGLDPSEIESFEFTGTKKPLSDLLSEAEGEIGLSKYKKREITFEEFRSHALPYQGKFLDALWKVINRYKTKENSKTKFLEFTAPEGVEPNVGGLQLSLAKGDTSYVALVKDFQGNILAENSFGNVATHELLHDYTKMMYHRLYSTDKEFAKEVNKVFIKIRNTALDTYEGIMKRVLAGNPTPQDMGTYLTALDVMQPTAKAALGKALQEGNAQKAATAMSSGIYGYTNAEEFMAEGFSNTRFMLHLASIKLNEPITKGINKGERKSLLYKWYDQLTTYLKQEYRKHVVDKDYQEMSNALDYFMEFIADFDQEFLGGELTRKTDYDKTPFFRDWMAGTAQAKEDIYDLMSLAVKDKAPKDEKLNKEIIKNLFGTLKARKEIKTEDDLKDYIARINKNFVKAGKPQKQLSERYAKILDRLIKSERNDIKSKKERQAKTYEFAQKQPDYKTNFQYKKTVDAFASVDVSDLNRSERNTYDIGFGKLAYNQVSSKASFDIMINHGLKKTKKENLLPISDKLNSTYEQGQVSASWPYLKGVQRAAGGLSNITNPALFTTIVSKFQTIVGDKLLKNIYGGIMQGVAKANTESHDLVLKINKVADSSNAGHHDLVGVGIIGSIFSTVSDPFNKLEWENEVTENAQHVYESSKNKMVAYDNKTYFGDLSKDQIQDEINIAKSVLDRLKDSFDINKIMTKPQQAIYDTIREFVTKHENDFERNAVGVWGKSDYVRRFNYFPTYALGKMNGENSNDALLDEKQDNLFDAVSDEYDPATRQFVGNELAGKKAGAINARVNPKGYYYEYDALAIASRHAKKTLFDLYNSVEFKALNRLLKDPEFKKKYPTILVKSFTHQLRHIAGGDKHYDTFNKDGLVQKPGGTTRWLARSRDYLYTSMIATVPQFVLQASSGLVAASTLAARLNPKTSTKNLAKAISSATAALRGSSKETKFLYDHGLGIQGRDIFFETWLKPEDYKSGNKQLKQTRNFVENKLNTGPTRAGDKWAAAVVWFATYYDAGGTLDTPDHDAIIRAERMTGVLQNMSDVSFSAPMFRSDTKLKKFALMMLYGFKSFALNGQIALGQGTRYSLSSDEARRVASAHFAGLVAYRLFQNVIAGQIYAAVAKMITGGDDDEEKRYSFWGGLLWNAVWDALGGMGNPQFIDGMMRYIFNKTEGAGMLGNGIDEFDQYLDSPIYSVKKSNDLYKQLVGPPYGDVVESALDGINQLIEYSKADEFDTTLDDTGKRNEDAKLWAALFTTMLYSATWGMPFKGDLKRIVDKTVNKVKSDRFKEKKGDLGIGGTGEDIDLMNQNELVLPPVEYNLDEQ